MSRRARGPDLQGAGAALEELRRLWPFDGATVFVGLTVGDQRVAVGYVRERTRKACRITGPTLSGTMELARTWTAANPTQIAIELAESKRETERTAAQSERRNDGTVEDRTGRDPAREGGA